MQGHPAAAWGPFPLQEPPKRRALASGCLRFYAPDRLGPMRKTRKQDSKNIYKKCHQACMPRHADPASPGACSLEAYPLGFQYAENRVEILRFTHAYAMGPRCSSLTLRMYRACAPLAHVPCPCSTTPAYRMGACVRSSEYASTTGPELF